MSNFRASSVVAIPPKAYGSPKGHFYKGVDEMERFPPQYPTKEDVFEEYLENKSLSPSRHRAALSKSSGLMELHYDTMRKKQTERAAAPSFIHGPTMTRPFKASAGYSGFIPGKISNNIVGCASKNCSQLAYETRGQFYKPPGSGVVFTLGARSMSSPSLGRSGSILGASGADLLSPKRMPGQQDMQDMFD